MLGHLIQGSSTNLYSTLWRTFFIYEVICQNGLSIFNLFLTSHKLGFPTGQDSATFLEKGTEVTSLSRDKGATGQAQNLAKGQERPGKPVKI